MVVIAAAAVPLWCNPASTASDTVRIGSSASNRTPNRRDALACGSRSTTSTRRPASASAAARLTTAAVLPTPPLLFPTATRGGIAPPPVIRYSRHTGAPQHRNQVIRHFVGVTRTASDRSEEHTSELQSRENLV